MEQLLAWHSDPKKKAARLKRVRAHMKADQLIQGYGYWKDGKGCAFGCSYHSSDHMLMQEEDGIPVGIAYLVDRLFERLPQAEARTWPERFFNAIKPGTDLSLVWDKNWEWVLREMQKEFQPKNRPVLDGIIALFSRRAVGEAPTRQEAHTVGDEILAYRADRAGLADLTYRAYLADLADLAYRADLADLADLTYRTGLADLAYRAYLADLADLACLADLTDLAVRQSKYLIKLLKAAPVVKRARGEEGAG